MKDSWGVVRVTQRSWTKGDVECKDVCLNGGARCHGREGGAPSRRFMTCYQRYRTCIDLELL